MVDIYELMADQSRQSFFQLENTIASLDSKSFGVMTADALLFSAFTFVLGHPCCSSKLFYISPSLIIISFALLLASTWPRRYRIQTAECVINKYGSWETKLVLAQLAANYADLERRSLEIYKNKFNWFYAGLVLMAISMAVEMIVYTYITFDP